jgi:hypothetical protein
MLRSTGFDLKSDDNGASHGGGEGGVAKGVVGKFSLGLTLNEMPLSNPMNWLSSARRRWWTARQSDHAFCHPCAEIAKLHHPLFFVFLVHLPELRLNLAISNMRLNPEKTEHSTQHTALFTQHVAMVLIDSC